MMMRQFFFRDVWSLVTPYWRSEEKYSAWAMLAVVIALNLALVYLNILLNGWNSEFYDSLQDRDRAAFFGALIKFSWIAGLFIVHNVYQSYMNQLLLIRWRRWMTKFYMEKWLANKAYYRMQIIDTQSDNPDQRMADDINQFTDLMLGLTLGLMSSIVTLFSFLFILWTLSGTVAVTLFGQTYMMPGSMVLAAILYAFIGTLVTVKLGRPLVGLNFDQHRYEADFRFGLVRVRENSESIAFYGGEEQEKKNLVNRFSFIFRNTRRLMERRKTLAWFTASYQQISFLLPYLFVAPRFFSGQIKLGAVMQTASAFGQVQLALSYIVNTYNNIALWKADVERLTSFLKNIAQTENTFYGRRSLSFHDADDNALHVKKMTLRLPNGYILMKDIVLTINKGESVLLKGTSGSGKSTLLRALAGLWPYAEGQCAMPKDAVVMFVPQRPYLPLGSLRQAICYPLDQLNVDDTAIAKVLTRCHLRHLADRIDENDNWSHILSLGEQQRMAFARILLQQPDILFLDESSSALDEVTEAYLYGLIKSRLPDMMMISVGHRQTLEQWHDSIVDVTQFQEESVEPVTQA